MKSLYYIEIKDKTTGSVGKLHIADMQHVTATLIKDGAENEYELDFSNSNLGLVEDMVKAAEWLRKKLNEQENSTAECYINTEIYTSSIEFDGKDDIWDCLKGAIELCRGEHMIQYGSSVISQGYNILENFININ